MLSFTKLQTKMLVSFLTLVLIPVIAIGTFSYLIATRFLEKQTTQNQAQTVRLTAGNIKGMLDDATDLSSYIVQNETIQTLLSQPSPSGGADPQKTIYNVLNNLKQAKTYISFLIMYGENDLLFRDFSQYYRQVVPYGEFKESPLYVATAARSGEPHWDYSGAPLFIFGQNYDDIILNRQIVSMYDTDKKLGMFFLGVKRDAMKSLIQDVQINQTTNLLLFDDNYHLIASKFDDIAVSNRLKDNVGEIKRLQRTDETFEYAIGKKTYLAASSFIEPYGWTVVSLTPMEDIRRQHGIMLGMTVALSLSLILIAVALSVVLSRGITSPIKRLLKSMNSFKLGQPHPELAVRSRDEIGHLTQKYNEMVHDLNDLIEKVYISQTNQRMIELRTLQAQIEPHFLYNTLDYIFFNAKINGDDRTAQVVHSLSELFRLSLNKGEDFYKLENEIKQIQAYVNIQHARFPNRFVPLFDIDPAIGGYYTMKLLLQPIVENAILHAFEPSAYRQGLLSIRGHITDDAIVWTVQDNGCGMSAEQVELLLHIPARSKGGYGLRNVNERLQMMFGPAFALQIASSPGAGTIVTVRIPIIEDEEQWRRLYENHGHR